MPPKRDWFLFFIAVLVHETLCSQLLRPPLPQHFAGSFESKQPTRYLPGFEGHTLFSQTGALVSLTGIVFRTDHLALAELPIPFSHTFVTDREILRRYGSCRKAIEEIGMNAIKGLTFPVLAIHPNATTPVEQTTFFLDDFDVPSYITAQDDGFLWYGILWHYMAIGYLQWSSPSYLSEKQRSPVIYTGDHIHLDFSWIAPSTATLPRFLDDDGSATLRCDDFVDPLSALNIIEFYQLLPSQDQKLMCGSFRRFGLCSKTFAQRTQCPRLPLNFYHDVSGICQPRLW